MLPRLKLVWNKLRKKRIKPLQATKEKAKQKEDRGTKDSDIYPLW